MRAFEFFKERNTPPLDISSSRFPTLLRNQGTRLTLENSPDVLLRRSLLKLFVKKPIQLP
ncbi:hypothetical protein IB69_016650 [Xanthomonas citri]|nr:hypothetical protein IB69_016650 [Xanthomonas citri]